MICCFGCVPAVQHRLHMSNSILTVHKSLDDGVHGRLTLIEAKSTTAVQHRLHSNQQRFDSQQSTRHDGVHGRFTLIEASSKSILRHVMIACFCSASVGTAAPPQAASICSAAAKATASCLTCDASGAVLDAPYQDTGLEGSAGSFR